jgi:alkanesulfonate monooxygenase SsuD/methylene tetrahydromethanopterin reductase-like flavin-dependent oxidoreductase (luciferase family)
VFIAAPTREAATRNPTSGRMAFGVFADTELSLFHRYGRAVAQRTATRPDRELVLIGSPAQITETLQKVEATGFDEVILYFNVGLKPHAQVKDEMARFMAGVAPVFADSSRLDTF